MADAASAAGAARARVVTDTPSVVRWIRWPSSSYGAVALLAAHFGIGVADQPGGAAKVRDLDYRYQYLAGGVNTGNGWATWNPDGTFVSRYVAESRAARVTPVFTY